MGTVRRALVVLLVTFVLLISLQHMYLDEVLLREKQQQQEQQQQQQQQPLSTRRWPPRQEPEPPAPPPSPPPSSAATSRITGMGGRSFDDGESIGAPSTSVLCVVMPVRSNSLPKALRNVRSWSTARGAPCTSKAAAADLCIIHSQSFTSVRDVEQARALLDALARPKAQPEAAAATGNSSGQPSTVASCFGAVRFLAARIPIERDVYTIYPTHNFSGPNEHFLQTFASLGSLRANRIASYTHFQLMESDTYPYQPGWLRALEGLTHRRHRERVEGKGGAWVQGSRSLCLRASEIEHVNGNALYSLDKGFTSLLKKEMAKKFDSWAFDVLIGHWLYRQHPHRIRESSHVLSISTFQRNRTCCEMVRGIVAYNQRPAVAYPGEPAGEPAAASAELARPELFLLHTGNIFKLRDSAVPPSMRSLGLALQDLFVPRSEEPCVLESAMAADLRRCLQHTQPWRARVKGQASDCKLSSPLLVPMLWAPLLASPAASPSAASASSSSAASSAAAATRLLLVQSFGALHVTEITDDADGGTDGGAVGGVDALISTSFPALLRAIARHTAPGLSSAQLVVLLSPPVEAAWRAFQAASARAVLAGAPPLRLASWLAKLGPNPLVRTLSGCDGGDSGGDGSGGGGALSDVQMLERARTLLQERAVVGILTPNATARSLRLLGAFFRWSWRADAKLEAMRSEVTEAAHGAQQDASDRDGGGAVEDTAEGEGAEAGGEVAAAIPAVAFALLSQQLALDARLYDFGSRLSDEQHRSAIWVEDSSEDACAAAEAAGEAAGNLNLPVEALPLEQASPLLLILPWPPLHVLPRPPLLILAWSSLLILPRRRLLILP